MSEKSVSSSSSSGIGFIGALQILFIGLKLTGYIDWSWPMVLAPAIISFSVGLFLALLIIGLLYSDRKHWGR